MNENAVRTNLKYAPARAVLNGTIEAKAVAPTKFDLYYNHGCAVDHFEFDIQEPTDFEKVEVFNFDGDLVWMTTGLVTTTMVEGDTFIVTHTLSISVNRP